MFSLNLVKANLQKNYGKYIKKKVGVARLKPTRDDNSKGPLIGPSLFYTSKLYNKYIKIRVTSYFVKLI